VPAARAQALALVPICLLVFLDYYPAGLTRTNVVAPRAYVPLAGESDAAFGILDLPRGYLQGNAYMFYQTFHHRPIVSATLSRNITWTLMDNLITKDLAAQKQQLIEKRVKYIFIHRDPFSLRNPGEQLDVSAYAQAYPTVYSDPNCIVMRVY
jgi:hypothetical protein